VRTRCSTILLVERSAEVKQAIERALLCEGLEVAWARSAGEAERAVQEHDCCLILLNPYLPPDDGWALLRRLRRQPMPLVVLVPSDDPTVKRLALALGADDCLTSRTPPHELATRVRFVLRRAEQPAQAPLSFGEVTLAPASGGAQVRGQAVALTPTEYSLLRALVEAQGRVVPREQLVLRARGQAGTLPLARSIEAHVRSLRRKLGDDPEAPRLLLTVRGFGYRLAPSAGASRPDLVEATLQALSDPILVLDEQRRVKLMNPAAERLTGRPASAVLGSLRCSALLACRVNDPACEACPWYAAQLQPGPQRSALVLYPQEEPLPVEVTAIKLPGESGLLLQLREREHA
jgi:DNA-binding response OmpR family regulator